MAEYGNWDTTFDTANNLMIHDFGADIKVVTNIKTEDSSVYKNGNVVRTIETGFANYSYPKFLKSVSVDAEKLKKFKVE